MRATQATDTAGATTAGVMGTSAIFTAAVTLAPAEPEHFDLAFTAVTQPCPWPKAYGGDLVSAAAGEAGGTFEAGPDDTPLGRAGAVPGPDVLPASAAYLDAHAGTPLAEESSMTERSRAYWSGGRSFDMRHVPDPVYLTVEGERVPHQAVWVKPFDALRHVPGLSDEQRDLAALAYVCDYTILEPVLRVLGLAWAKPGLVTASLDHAMWFHRTASIDAGAIDSGAIDSGAMDSGAASGGWLLYAQEAVAAGAGRGVGAGRFFTRDHRHLATVVQEGMFRSA